MSDAVAAPAPKAVKTPKKKAAAKPKKPADHPKYSEMLKDAIAGLKERGGSSRQAILKYIMANFKVEKDEKQVNAHLKMALRAGAKNASLKQTKGTGASGSFRIGEVKKAAKPKKVTKPKAAKPKKATKPKAKKAGTPKKAAAKPKKAVAKPKKVAAKPAKKVAAKPAKKVAAKPAKKAAAKPAKKAAAKPKKAAAKK
jgi:histone H1/5